MTQIVRWPIDGVGLNTNVLRLEPGMEAVSVKVSPNNLFEIPGIQIKVDETLREWYEEELRSTGGGDPKIILFSSYELFSKAKFSDMILGSGQGFSKEKEIERFCISPRQITSFVCQRYIYLRGLYLCKDSENSFCGCGTFFPIINNKDGAIHIVDARMSDYGVRLNLHKFRFAQYWGQINGKNHRLVVRNSETLPV